MLTPLILPFQWTLMALCGLFVVAFVFSRRRKATLVQSLAWAALACALLLIPTFAGLSYIVDHFRYGEFHYASPAAIRDPYIELPPAACDIEVRKFASGHRVRFTIAPDSMTNWLAKQHAQPDVVDRAAKQIDPESQELRRIQFASQFGQYGWTPTDDMQLYEGPTSRRGGGFRVWYDASSSQAFLSAAYW